MIDSLTTFTVAPKYTPARTFYRVYVKGTREPVAEVRVEPGLPLIHTFPVLTGPGLDQLAGRVNAVYAEDADGRRIGQVDKRRGVFTRTTWTFAQDGLPELRGVRAGFVGSLRDKLPVVRDFLANSLVDILLSLHLKFSAPGCPGFTFSRKPGIRTRYKVRVRDERVSRLLVLSVVLRYHESENPDLGEAIREAKAHPIEFWTSVGDLFQ